MRLSQPQPRGDLARSSCNCLQLHVFACCMLPIPRTCLVDARADSPVLDPVRVEVTRQQVGLVQRQHHWVAPHHIFAPCMRVCVSTEAKECFSSTTPASPFCPCYFPLTHPRAHTLPPPATPHRRAAGALARLTYAPRPLAYATTHLPTHQPGRPLHKPRPPPVRNR